MKTIPMALLLAGAALPAFAQLPNPDRRETPALSSPPTAQAPSSVTAQANAGVALTSVVVEGVLPSSRVDSAWRPFVGRQLNSETLKAAADAVSSALREDGLALYTVRVPEQSFDGGVLRLSVTQGQIEEVIFHGETTGDMALARAYAAALTAERPLAQRTLERYLSLLRDIPGLTADIQLLEGASPGGVKLVAGLATRRSEVAYTLHTRTQPLLGDQVLQADTYLNGLIRQGDQTVVSGAVSSDLESYRRIGLSHSTPVGTDGARAQASVGYSRTLPQSLPIKGVVKSASLQFSYPVIRGYRDNLILALSADGLNSDSAVFGQTLATEATRVARLSANWTRERTNNGLALGLSLSHGLDGLGADVNPLLASADFAKANLSLAYNRKLTPSFLLRLRGAAQATNDPLPSSEQMGLGGALYGRAFDTSVLLADHGQAASAELAWTRQTPITGPALAEAYAFADAGELHRNARPTIPAASDHLSSAGLGLRVAFGPKFQLGLEAAKPLDRPAGFSDDVKWSFSLAGRY